jgi:hypothetical protein
MGENLYESVKHDPQSLEMQLKDKLEELQQLLEQYC